MLLLPFHQHLIEHIQQLSQSAAHPATSQPFQSNPLQQRFSLDLFAGHSAPLTVAAKAANLDHFFPFDIEFTHLCNVLDDSQFENLLQLAHSGLIGAIWSAPPCKHPCRKNLGKIIGIILWATSMVHHTRFLLTSLYRNLYAIPATNYSIPPTQWEYFLSTLNDDAIISVQNSLHLPIGARIVEFRHSNMTRKSQLPTDIPIESRIWLRMRVPILTRENSPMNPSKPYNGSSNHYCPSSHPFPLIAIAIITINAAADAFATDDTKGIGGWVTIQSSFWFSQIWNKSDLLTFLPVTKDLQRYITSCEALAQLCIIRTVHQKCETTQVPKQTFTMVSQLPKYF